MSMKWRRLFPAPQIPDEATSAVLVCFEPGYLYLAAAQLL